MPAHTLLILASLGTFLGTDPHFLGTGAEARSLNQNGSPRYQDGSRVQSVYHWGPWSEFSECSRSCGVGIHNRHRDCYVTRPRFLRIADHRLCGEVDTEYQTCNTQPCYSSTDDFRAEQCTAYNNKLYEGRFFQWKPYNFKNKAGLQQTKLLNQCALICVAEDHSPFTFAVQLADTVVDGTPCQTDDGKEGICVRSKCLPVGCDKVLYSLQEQDKCGVCGGHNNTCHLIAADIEKQVHLGYNDIFSIPEKACHIQVVDESGSSSVFALRNVSGIYFVNGQHSTSYPTVYSNVAGTTFYYHHPLYERNGQERIEAEGPTTETLFVMVLCPENVSEVHISYEFTVQLTPQTQQTSQSNSQLFHQVAPAAPPEPTFLPEEDHYMNMISYQGHRAPKNDYTGEKAESSVTSSDTNNSRALDSNETFKPKTDQDTGYPDGAGVGVGENKYHKPKKKDTFKFYWKTDEFAPCSVSCTKGVQTSFAKCYRSDKMQVEDKFCDLDPKPEATNIICDGRPCPPRWVVSTWSKCSVSCGDGRQFRSARCWRILGLGFDSTVTDDLCSADDKPVTVRGCRQIRCGPLWETSQWTECSAKCGVGVQRRFVRCSVIDQPCDPLTKPRSVRYCNEGACSHKWVVSDWTKCSGPCGSGARRRSVTCRSKNSTLQHDKFCDQNRRPLVVEPCGDTPDCPPVWTAQEWGICSAECGEGLTSRQVLCGAAKQDQFVRMRDATCRHLYRPTTRTRCKEAPCGAKWFTSEWSQCSKSCGPGGVRIRKVSCYRDNSPSFGCDYSQIPPKTEPCDLPGCGEAQQPKECSDDPVTNCALVREVQLCDHRHYRKACCHTCKQGHMTTQNSSPQEEEITTAPTPQEVETQSVRP